MTTALHAILFFREGKTGRGLLAIVVMALPSIVDFVTRGWRKESWKFAVWRWPGIFHLPILQVGVTITGQVSIWQSATLLPISCKYLQPVPDWVEQPLAQ